MINVMTSIKILFVVGISWIGFTECLSQQANGFYFVVEGKKNCPYVVFSFDEKRKYCLTKEPILNAAEFESVSEVQNDRARQLKFVNLQLTKKGFALIKKLTSQLPNKELLLVVNDHVVGTFNGANQVISRTIPISGSVDSQVVDWVYNQLKKPL
jgi:preprotein translocase subunit SecD